MKVTYDRYGRMKYHPEYHHKHGQPWIITDQKYLIEYYEKLGPEQVSFALGRTIHTVMQRAAELRKAGLMPMPKTQSYHRRMRPTFNAGENHEH
jgi:hypothetical protein